MSTAAQPMIGDFAVTKIPGLAGRAIALGQWLIGKPSPVQHAYVYVGSGDIVQAMPGGATLTQVADAEPAYAWSSSAISLTASQRARIAGAARTFVGTPYSYLDYLSIGLSRWGLRPAWLRRYVEDDKHAICSQLVDAVYQWAGVQLFTDGRIPGDVTPSDLFALIAPKAGMKP